MSRVDQKLAFDRWAESFNIDGERRDRLWSIMVANSLSPDDVNVYFLGAAGVLEKVADQVKTSTGDLPAKIEAAAAKAVGPIAKAATAEAERHQASMISRASHEIGIKAAEVMEAAIASRRFVVSGVVAGVVGIAILLAAYAGWHLGNRNVADLDSRVRAIAARSDVSTVLTILQGNPDLDATIAGYCQSGGGRVVVADGVRNCTVPLWLDGRASGIPAGTERGTVLTAWNAGAAMFNRFSPWTLVLGGILTGLLLRKAIILTGKVPGVKWLTT